MWAASWSCLLCGTILRKKSKNFATYSVHQKIESDSRKCKYIRRTVVQEVSREYLKPSLQAMQEAVEKALSGLFITCTTKAEGGLKSTPYKFIGTIRTNMTQNRALDIWSQYWLLDSVNIVHGRIYPPCLESARFTPPVAQFTKARMDENSNEWRLPAKAERFSSGKLGNSWLQPPPPLSSSDESDCQKRHRKHCKASAPGVIHQTRKAKRKDRYSIASSDRDTCLTSSGYEFSIPDLSGNARPGKLSKPLVTAMEQEMPVLQTIN